MVASPSDASHLTRYGVQIYQSDLNSLDDRNWLTSKVIRLMAKHLEHDYGSLFPDMATIVYPEQCTIIEKFPGSSYDLASMGLSPSKWTLFLYNSDVDPNLSDSGTHYSLIVFCPDNMLYFHYDSMGGGNRVPGAVYNFLAHVDGYLSGSGGNFAFNKRFLNGRVQSVNCPKMQFGGGDCGIYMLEYLNSVLMFIKNQGPFQNQSNVNFNQFLGQNPGRALRQKWKKIIYELGMLQESVNFGQLPSTYPIAPTSMNRYPLTFGNNDQKQSMSYQNYSPEKHKSNGDRLSKIKDFCCCQ